MSDDKTLGQVHGDALRRVLDKLSKAHDECVDDNMLSAMGFASIIDALSFLIKRGNKVTGQKIDEKSMRRLLCKMGDLFVEKNKNYGCSVEISLNKYGLIAGLTRLSDKFNRAETLILNHDVGTDDESLMDTLLDLATYSVMIACYLEKRDEENHEG